jgi:hypothetical protein
VCPSLTGVRGAADPAFEPSESVGDARQHDAAGGAGWRLFGAEVRRVPVCRGTPSLCIIEYYSLKTGKRITLSQPGR